MNKKGNIFVPLVLAIAILAVVALGYLFWKNQQNSGQALGPYTPPVSNSPDPALNSDTSNWKTYMNIGLNFSLKYPANWDKLEESNGNHVRFFKGKYSPNLPMPETYISIQVKEKGDISVKSWLLAEGLLPTAMNPEPHIRVQDITIDGIAGVKISTPVNGGQDTFYLPDGTKILQITYVFKGSELKDYENLTKLFDKILSTFKFTDSNSDTTTPTTNSTDTLAKPEVVLTYQLPSGWKTVDTPLYSIGYDQDKWGFYCPANSDGACDFTLKNFNLYEAIIFPIDYDGGSRRVAILNRFPGQIEKATEVEINGKRGLLLIINPSNTGSTKKLFVGIPIGNKMLIFHTNVLWPVAGQTTDYTVNDIYKILRTLKIK